MRKTLLIIICTLFVAGGVVRAEMQKGPYLIYPGENTQMTVLWQLGETLAEGCRLEWGTSLEYGSSVTVTESGSNPNEHQYEYTIGTGTALDAGIKYYYRVREGISSGAYHTGGFRTAPAATAHTVKLMVYGDTRSYPKDHNAVNEGMIELFEADPNYQSITLLTGDWVNKGEAEDDWDEQFFDSSYSHTHKFQANMPINGCIGNHEWDSGSNPPTLFDKYWPYPYVDGFYWSFDYGPAHIAVVDQYDEDYSPSSAQLTWLENDLATTEKEWKFVMFHAPGYSAGGHDDNDDVRNYIQPLCETYRVDIVFCGHNHYYARCDVNGVKHITTGGGGAPLKTPDLNYSSYVESCTKTHHFCRIAINGRRLDLVAMKPDGTVIDSFTLIHAVAGDFEPDGDVDWDDLKTFVGRWPESCNEPNWCDGCDIDQLGTVDFLDFALCARNWLTGIE